MTSFIGKLARKKYIDKGSVTETKLARCLTTLDLTALGIVKLIVKFLCYVLCTVRVLILAQPNFSGDRAELGIGSTLGAGIYVVAGQVAMETAGPSVMLSFLIAAVASVLAGLCYAEFGARVPKTGSAYVYSYVTVGELMAFIIGWNLILEYVIGTASVARAWSSYFDSLINKTIQNFFLDTMPMNVPGLSPYPDFFALGITLMLTGILAVGVKESSRFNNIFTVVNLLIVTFMVIGGLINSDISNWKISPDDYKWENSTGVGDGGFLPFGVSGMLSGAATCFYAFVGFDCIATTGEEVKNPQKAIPISIVLSLTACFLAYFGVSAVLTLMSPYFLLDHDAPLPAVFQYVGWEWARYAIAVGAVCGLSTSLLGAMFPLPRVIYAMASDGLLFKFLSNVNEKFKTPLIGTILSGSFAGIMAMLFDLKELVDMMSIGTLLAYTLVAFSVLLLRNAERGVIRNYLADMFNHKSKEPTHRTEDIAVRNIAFTGVLIVIISLVLILLGEQISQGVWWAIAVIIVICLFIFVIVYSIWLQPENQDVVSFKVPLLPFLPILSMFVNIYLMMKLSSATWIRFAVWMVVGFVIYFAYGIRNSVEGNYDEHIPLTASTTLIVDDNTDDSIEEFHDDVNDDNDDNDESHLIWIRKKSSER
ncbi:hypothetical protein FSP39_014398 [Pinctada imbricata]|uniref:Cationic amino acid transporter C-terminal domain-containing protein n=1 Tax=Pinctada imbricata TaxID=66713 RepID=A0AA88YDH8_PINIB|nr:hypothetical protein FSP39_014398 [Pinctada imbricata]